MKKAFEGLVILAFALLPACGPVQSALPLAPEPTPHQFGQSWVLPEAESEDLLYTSDVHSNYVYISDFPQGKLVGKLGAFNRDSLGGECSDASGNVFVSVGLPSNNSKILEYAHGGKVPIATLNDPYGGPRSCAVDRNTEDLAVVNLPDEILVFPGAKSPPTAYVDKGIEFFSCAFDNSGDLFAEGWPENSISPVLVELPAGSSALKQINLNTKYGLAFGSTQGNGKNLYLTSAKSATVHGRNFAQEVILTVRISGSSGRVVGKESMALYYNQFFPQFWLTAGGIVAQPEGNAGSVGVWKYPHGGRTGIITVPVRKVLKYAVISVADPKRHVIERRTNKLAPQYASGTSARLF